MTVCRNHHYKSYHSIVEFPSLLQWFSQYLGMFNYPPTSKGRFKCVKSNQKLQKLNGLQNQSFTLM